MGKTKQEANKEAKNTEGHVEHNAEKPPISDVVAAKRMSSPHERRGQLISAERTLGVGRREAPAHEIRKYERDRKRRVYIGLALAVVAVVIVMAVVMLLGSDIRI